MSAIVHLGDSRAVLAGMELCSVDAIVTKKWFHVCKAIDSSDQFAILAAWKEHSRTASGVGLSFQKSKTETGICTPKSGFVLVSVVLQANPENSDAVALVVELNLIDPRRTSEKEISSVLTSADVSESPSPAKSAGNQPRKIQAISTPTGTVQCAVRDGQSESMAVKLMAVEAPRIWLGSKPSSKRADTVALCVALTRDLKHIIASQSKTFQNYGTIRQTACVSATIATITESTAESPISFMVDMLKPEAKARTAYWARQSRSHKATKPTVEDAQPIRPFG